MTNEFENMPEVAHGITLYPVQADEDIIIRLECRIRDIDEAESVYKILEKTVRTVHSKLRKS